jgi:hypothetical protein
MEMDDSAPALSLAMTDHAGDGPPRPRPALAIDPTRISTKLGWQPHHSFQEGPAVTVTAGKLNKSPSAGGHESRAAPAMVG